MAEASASSSSSSTHPQSSHDDIVGGLRSRSEELTEDAPSVHDLEGAKRGGDAEPRRAHAHEEDEGERETRAEDVAGRTLLRKILDAMVIAAAAEARATATTTVASDVVVSIGAIAEAEALGAAKTVASSIGPGLGLIAGGGGGGSGAMRVFVEEHLCTIAHLSHRRERHCRLILQHAAADIVVNYIADILAGGARASVDSEGAVQGFESWG